MRIGIDARLPYYRRGGISQYVIHLIRGLARLDDDHIFQIFHSHKDKETYIPAGADFRRRNLLTPCHHRFERWSLSLELIPAQLDVLHSPDFIPPAHGARRKIITVHDLNFVYYPQFLTPDSRRYYLDQISRAVVDADHILVDSNHTHQDLVELEKVPAEKVTTVHLAANEHFKVPPPDDLVKATLKELNLAPGYILFVGTLEPRKNIPMLLHAFKALREETGVDVPLVLIGRKGWLYEEIFNTIKELQIGHAVRHLGGVNDVKLACLYREAALLALPSFYEGFGLPSLEAMHMGCPVIASKRASLPEVVGKGGILLDPEDTTAWTEAMGNVIYSSELREQMVAAGQRQASAFSWDKTAKETMAAYIKNG